MRWSDGITDALDLNLGKLWELVKDRKAWHPGVLQDWSPCDSTGHKESDMT